MLRKKIGKFMLVMMLGGLALVGCRSNPSTSSSSSSSSSISTNVSQYQVAFEENGGSEVASITVNSGGQISAVTSIKEDYTLDGWFEDANFTNEWDFTTDIVLHDVTLYAQWIFSYTLTGEGSLASPYLVASAKDLEVIRTGKFITTATMYFSQTTDLTITSDYEAIDEIEFLGIYDGNDHTVTVTGDTGIFYEVSGVVTDLTISGDIETSTVSSIGMLANYNSGIIRNVTATGTGIRSLVGTVGTMGDIGGAGAIVGTNRDDGLIERCENRTNVQARVGGGGIAGTNHGEISLSSSYGTIGESEVIFISNDEMSIGKFSYMGGIVGINTGTIQQSQNRGRVFAQRAGNTIEVETNNNKVFGGIAGYNAASGVVTECYNAYGTAGPTVHADRIVGGIVGQNFGQISYCYSPANIGARANIGGIVGLSDESITSVAEVTNCWSNSNFNSGSNEEDEIGAFAAADATNWYAVAKYSNYSYYHNTRGLAPEGEGNTGGASVSLDMTSTLNHGHAVGEEKFVITDGSSSGNTKTKLSWQKVVVTFEIDGIATDVEVLMGNTPNLVTPPTKNGYDFVEWRTDLLDSNTKWNLSGVTSNTKVYAYFGMATYQINYELDRGINATNNPSSYTIESPSFELLAPSREGCTFLRWVDENNQPVTSIPQGTYGTLNLIAEWQINVDFIRVDLGSSYDETTLLNLIGDSYVLPTPEQQGYEFLGWSLDGTTVAYQGGDSINYSNMLVHATANEVTMTPLFEQIFNYTVAYDGNGASGSMISGTAVSGREFTLSINQFSADGYTFCGWLYDGVLYDDGAIVTNLALSGETATLIAQWVGPNDIVVNGDFETGSTMISEDSKTYTSGGWSVYRNGTTTVPELTPVISEGQMVIDATVTAAATSLNFYTYTIVTLTDIEIGKYYYVSFNADASDVNYNNMGVYIRSKASGSTTFKTVASLVTFDTIDTTTSTFSTVLQATGNIAEGNTYYLIVTLGNAQYAGTLSFHLDNIQLYDVGSVSLT